MRVIVQKFGGTSVADSQKILAAARKAIRTQQQGAHVVVVVSAQGDTTDDLIEKAQEIHDDPPAREMDMLLSTGEQISVALMAMACESLGSKAISLTGGQIGIKTDSTHGKARIQSISTARLKKALDEGRIVIAAGFQGIDDDLNITTLGRGGSDTTAVALAAVLRADECEIYTDVDGVYTTDPRILPAARKLERISYDEMLELASLGAGVMHNRSIEFGRKFGVPIHVRSSFSDVRGTIIADEPESRAQPVTGAALAKNEARISLLGVPDRPGTLLSIFSPIAKKNIAVDMIVQNVAADGKADVSFTVLKDDVKKALALVNDVKKELGASGVSVDDEVAKVSVVGLGMAQQTGVARQMFDSLAAAGVNIQMISTSEIKISVIVTRAQAADALRAVHETFQLHQAPADRKTNGHAHPSDSAADAKNRELAIVQRLQRVQAMEALTVDEVTLDESQALVTLVGLPDTPGLAAKVFQAVGDAGVFVDMIVQDASIDREAALSFTVPQASLEQTKAIAAQLSTEIKLPTASTIPAIAKLSVSGVGLRSNTQVAIRMFRALSDAGINVRLVSTSEVRVNVIVDGARGKEALQALQSEFADALK